MRTQNISLIADRKLEIINFIKSVDDNSLIEKVWKMISTSSVKNDDESKEEILKDIKAGFEEMKLIKKGKLKATPLKDFF